MSAGLNLIPCANSIEVRSVGVNILRSFLQKVVEQQIPEGPKDIRIDLDQSGLVAPMLFFLVHLKTKSKDKLQQHEVSNYGKGGGVP